MGALDRLFGIFRWLAHAFISITISIIIMGGTLIAVYSNFESGMAIFLVGCVLTGIHRGYRMLGMRHGVTNAMRIYMSSALSLIINVVFGYGGAYVIYVYGMSVRTSSPLMAALLPERAPAVFALTSVIYASLQILLAVARAVLAFGFTRSQTQRQELPQPRSQPRSKSPRKSRTSRQT